LVWAGLFLVAAAASIYAFALTPKGDGPRDKNPQSLIGMTKPALADDAPLKHTATPAERALSWKTQFGQFPPYTEAERELANMLCGKDEDIDLALANWLIVADMPEFADITRESYFKQLEGVIDQVRQDMAKMQTVAESRGKNINDPKTRCNIFCNAIIKLHFAYRAEFAQHDLTPLQEITLHGDPNNTFLAGLLRTKRGTCVSMPLIYLVIGQKFGFPVHLVSIGKHYFIRWEEPSYRIDIETTFTEKAMFTDDDSAYLEEEGMTRDQLKGSDLRNLSNREVVGNLFFTRCSYWVMRATKTRVKSWMDISRAIHLSPDDPSITQTYQAIFNHYGIKPEDTMVTLKQKESKGT